MHRRSVLALLVLACSCQGASEGSAPSSSSPDRPRIRAELATLNLSRLARKECRLADRDGKTSVYEGVSLSETLGLMGVTVGVHPKGKPPVEYVLVEGADGYRALFSKAELDPAFTEGTVILADRQDGRPVGSGEGPWRLIVPSDKIRSRWVKEVRAIEVSSPP